MNRTLRENAGALVLPQSYTITNWCIRPRRKFDGRQADDVQPNARVWTSTAGAYGMPSETGTSSSSGADKRTAPVNQHGRADLLACQRLGGRVVVVGRLQQRAWTAEDGSARSTVEVTADELGQASVGATATTTRTTRRQDQ